MAETIGFIGLGVMGKPMAGHLLNAGYSLVVHNRSRAPVDDLAKAGARAATSASEVARATSIVITMLPDTPDVERVLTGPDGVLSTIQRGAIVILFRPSRHWRPIVLPGLSFRSEMSVTRSLSKWLPGVTRR